MIEDRIQQKPTTPVPAGMVRVEKVNYHYGRQGQTTLVHHTFHDVPELEAIRWIWGSGFTSIEWPDGYTEHIDHGNTPIRVSTQYEGLYEIPGFTSTGVAELFKMSRLPNVAYGYYRPTYITPEQKSGAVKHESH